MDEILVCLKDAEDAVRSVVGIVVIPSSRREELQEEDAKKRPDHFINQSQVRVAG